MPKLVKLLTQATQQLQAQLLTNHAQLTQQQNDEALHHLRVSLRQLSSLLRPLRFSLDEAMVLDGLVKKMMESTNQIRDREVLILELRQHQMFDLADCYQQELQTTYLNVAQQPELEAIHQRLIDLSRYWLDLLSARTAQHLEEHIDQQWQQQSHKLFKLIQKKQQDKHRLRILIKHLRYNSEIYQTILPKRASVQTQQLANLQEMLGKWHDYFVFLTHAQQYPELHGLIPIWQQQLGRWEQESDHALKQLKRDKNFSS
ncbi:MAG: hypothetical protein NVS3B3_11640 [Aquirhabdus sp.]